MMNLWQILFMISHVLEKGGGGMCLDARVDGWMDPEGWCLIGRVPGGGGVFEWRGICQSSSKY